MATIQRSSDYLPGRLLLGCLAVLGLLLRTRRPLASSLVISAAVAAESVLAESPDEIPVLLAIIVSVFSVTAHGPSRLFAGGLAALAAAMTIAIATDPSDDLTNLVPTLALFLLLPAGLGLGFRRRGEDLRLMRARTMAAEQDAVRAAEVAVEAERRRLARELHDVVSHAVTLIAVQAEAGRSLLDRDPEGARRSLEAISVTSRDALAELQSLLTLLHEVDGTSGAGLADLPALLAGLRAAGARVDVEGEAPPRLPHAVDHCAYRVVQEGLTNALRHCRNPEVTVTIEQDSETVAISIVSRGRVHQSSYGGSGRGIAGLEARVHEFGGELQSGMEDERFVLRARLPVGAS